MRALVVTPTKQDEIKALVERAEARPTPYATMKLMAAKHAAGMRPETPPNRGMSLAIPHGYFATFTIEEHKPGKLFRHLSISVDTPGKAPHPAAVEMLMKEFGFTRALMDCAIWQENYGPDRTAINIVEPIDAARAQEGGR
jgi:hypothetical protein